MKKHFLLFTFITIYLATSCNTAFHVKHVQHTDPISGFMRYALPKNHTLVKLKLQKIVIKPGKYANDTLVQRDTDYMLILKRLNSDLQVENAFKPLKETADSIRFKFISLDVVDTFVVDKAQIFELVHHKKWNKKSSFSLTTSPRGIIQGIKIDETDQTLDLITEFGSAGARIAGSFILAPYNDTDDDTLTLKQLYSTTSKDDIRVAAALALELISVKKQIADLNKATNFLFVHDKAHYDQILKKYEDREKELTALFTIKKEVKEYNVEMVVDYTATQGREKTLCWIFPDKGVKFDSLTILIPSDTVGITTKKNHSGQKNVVDVSYQFYETTDQVITSATTFNNKAKSIDGGIRYRIPLFVQFELYTDKKMLKSKILPVSQLGEVVTLPKKFNTADITFYENLGLIKSISVSSSGISKEQISAIAGAAEKIDSMVPTEDQKLDKEVKHLELLKKKKDLEKQLGLD